jgi:phage FluMu protein Com
MTEVRCWRCGRKLYEVYASVVIPEGIVIAEKCGQCKAVNRTPLDSLSRMAVGFA